MTPRRTKITNLNNHLTLKNLEYKKNVFIQHNTTWEALRFKKAF